VQSHRPFVALGCAIGQGWYFGKPIPAEDAREMLVSQRDASGPVRAASARN
jgi:EAL domain-containing protein (putative c-di-GMP-specific phosphodiesterase class I)